MQTSNEASARDLILEVRSGQGGQEAALFASRLLRMYLRFAERKDWLTELVSVEYAVAAGVREAVVELRGAGAGVLLVTEAGTHRIQRVPATEKRGRLHTSTATVSVLPLVTATELEIDERDLRLDVFRASGRGGQGVNTTDSAVRLTHLPTGLVVTCQDERSQLKNRARALVVLRARLAAHSQSMQDKAVNRLRQGQLGRADRSERIRTYNFAQDRVTDHRLGRSFVGVERILDGEPGPIVSAALALQKEMTRHA